MTSFLLSSVINSHSHVFHTHRLISYMQWLGSKFRIPGLSFQVNIMQHSKTSLVADGYAWTARGSSRAEEIYRDLSGNDKGEGKVGLESGWAFTVEDDRRVSCQQECTGAWPLWMNATGQRLWITLTSDKWIGSGTVYSVHVMKAGIFISHKSFTKPSDAVHLLFVTSLSSITVTAQVFCAPFMSCWNYRNYKMTDHRFYSDVFTFSDWGIFVSMATLIIPK